MTTRKDLRSTLTAGAARARTTDDPQLVELAQAVEAVLAPGGWIRLRDTDPAKGTASASLSLRIDATVKELVKERSKNITADVNEGFAQYLSGEFVPRPYVQSRSMPGREKAVLSVRPNADLIERVKETGVPPSYVAAEFLMYAHRLGPYAPGAEESERLARGESRQLWVPTRIRDELRARAAGVGRWVTDDVNEGLAKFLAGEFTPFKLPWKVEDPFGESGLIHLRLRPNDDLYEQTRQAVKERSAELGWTPRPSQVALSYLLHKYGIEAE